MAKARTKRNQPAPEIGDRLARCRRELKRTGASALLLTNHYDYWYLTGFTGEESAVMVTSRDVVLLTDRRFENEIARDVPWAKAYLRRGSLNAEIATACKDLRVKKLAVQADHLSLAGHADIKKQLNGTAVVLAPPMLSQMRRFKDESEVARMLVALRVAEDAFVAARKTIRPGQTELEMAARLEYEMRTRGALSPAFPTICAEGPNAALPHAKAGKRKAKKGSAILFDWGARVNGYVSDLTRMVFVGSIPRKIREIYRITLEAQLAAIAEIRPGRRMCDVDAIARSIIDQAGYGKEFSHGLGHGLGFDVHEPPSLSWRSDEELAPGMIVTVEPGIYLSGVGGVRIEDDVLVTEKGCRILSRLPKGLDEAVV